MSIRTVERISDWESVPFAGGYDGLRSLADDEFSGAVVAGPTQLFMLNGTVVGVLDGEIEDFETAAGTARKAPHEALPLLAVMQERADEVRGQYYTQDTPVEDVDSTLSDGNFTGFVELSENVLSGDYFVVYHQGRSMSVAWVGSSQRLVTDDEAFDQANDEVGIYEVKPVGIEPIEIPEPAERTSGTTESLTADEGTETKAVDDDVDGVDTAAATETESSGTDDDAGTQDSAGERDSGPTSTSERASETAASGPPGSKAAGASHGNAVNDRGGASESTESRTNDTAGAGTEQSDSTTQQTAASRREPDSEKEQHTADVGAGAHSEPDRGHQDQTADPQRQPTADASSTRAPSDDRTAPEQSGPTNRQPPTTQSPQVTDDAATSSVDATGQSEPSVTDLETRSIPSLDPERSMAAAEQMSSDSDARSKDEPSSGAASSTTTRSAQNQSESPTSAAVQPEPRQQSSPTRSQEPVDDSPQTGGPDPQQLDALEGKLAEREDEITDLEAELDELAATNDTLRKERDELESKLADARAEIDRLEEQLADARGPGTTAGTQLSASEAIGNTNLFVRYNSKGEATLAKVSQGKATREEVETNLRLEYHTQFEAADAAVNGTQFEEFLHDTLQYRFVDWLVGDLLYEIGQTGHESSMQDLFEAIPQIDRAELNGQVSVEYTENGEQHRSQERFDVVVRDRMGNPLVVANINDSRDPASEDQMTTLVRNGERVGNASETLAGAFLVTSSFFAPEALETAEEATSSGLLSRDKKKSYVNLSRKDGFHLCLLEARNQEFHLAVPEL